MSIRVMTAVWGNSKQKGAALLLLLAIADFANDDGEAWPAVETLAKKIRMTERYTHMLIKQLAATGELTVDIQGGKHGCNLFIVGGVKPASPVKRASVRGEAGFPKGVKPASPEPPVTHQEPSGVKEPRPRDPMFDAVASVCQSDPKLQGSSIKKVAVALEKAGYTVADVQAFGKDWWAWKERTKPPTVWKLKDTISQVRAKAPTGSGRGPMLPEGLLDG